MKASSVSMKGKALLLVLAIGVLFGILFCGMAPGKRSVAKQKGVSWVAGRRPVQEQDLALLAQKHADWISQTPFSWQQELDSPELQMATDGHVHWGETDEGIETTARLARQMGIHTLLKPHVWLVRRDPGKWIDAIAMDSEENWRRWFDDYRRFILHYAQLAERCGIEALCVGTELHTAAVAREADWRRLISDVRNVYSGKLTYAANWYKEFEEVAFWDQLDYIGIQAYFPLSDKETPSVAELKRSWQAHVETIRQVQRKFRKPVLFTEVGYRSMKDAAIRPWEWPERSNSPADEAGLATQANCYEAFFQTFWNRDWVAGAYIWKWFPGAQQVRGQEFSPQGKPAEQVMTRWFGDRSNLTNSPN